MAKTKPAIEIIKLSKRYGDSKVFALRDLSISVYPGEVYGFLGPNGAGKSTTIRLLMNFIQPTTGSASILANDIVEQSVAVKAQVGYLASDNSMYNKMTGQQFLKYMQELTPGVNQSYKASLIKRLKADLNKKLGELSRGNRQKINLIQALMNEPAVLILDEPTSGLDPLMQEVFYDLLNEAKQRGACIFVSSHVLSEVQRMCDRVGIIREGRLIAQRSIFEMVHQAAQTFDITFASVPPIAAFKNIKGLQVTGHDDASITVHIHGKLAPLFAELAKHDVIKMDARNLDLEEVFLRFYKDRNA